MNDIANIQNEYSSYVGTVQSMIDSYGKTYHIRMKKDTSLDEDIIEKQNIIIAKLKNDNQVLKSYLSKAVIELKDLKQFKQKKNEPSHESPELTEYITNLETQNNQLKKQLQEIQSDLAKYKDTAQRQRDELQQEITRLKRQIQENIEGYETLQYVNQRRQLEINEKEKQIWQLQASIAQLTQSNFEKQSFIDRFKIQQDQKVNRQNFRYLGGSTTQKKSRNSRNNDDILIEGEEFMTTSQYKFVQRFNYGVQTQIIDAFQLSNRFSDRTPTKRKNHHITPQTDKDQKIREYARQLTQKQKQCANNEKACDLLKKQIKKLEEKIKEKEKQIKKGLKKYKKIAKKFGVSSNVQLSADSSQEQQSEVTPQKRSSKLSVDITLKHLNHAEIQTEEIRMKKQTKNNEKKQEGKQKGNNKSNVSSETSNKVQLSKKEKRRKNRTIENDQQDGRQKLKSLIEDLEKKQQDIKKLQSESTRNREVLNETRNKLRKKENQCKRLSRQLRNFKSQSGQKDSHTDKVSQVVAGDYSSRTSKVFCNEQIQTELIEWSLENQKPTHRRTHSDVNQSKEHTNQVKLYQKKQTALIKQNITDRKEQQTAHNQRQNNKQKSEQKPNMEELKITIPCKPFEQIMTINSPRSGSYSYRENGERVVDIQKLERLIDQLRQQNIMLKYELNDFRMNWIQGLKNIQRQYCSESGSDFTSQRDIIGALSDRQILPRKIRERFEEEKHSERYFKTYQKQEKKCAETQTQEIQGNIIIFTKKQEIRRSHRIIVEKSPKSQAKSDDLHNSHSKIELEASSEAEDYHFELKPVGQHESKKKNLRHNSTLEQEKLRIKNKQNLQLRRQIKQLQKELLLLKEGKKQQIKEEVSINNSIPSKQQISHQQDSVRQYHNIEEAFIEEKKVYKIDSQQDKESRYLSMVNNTVSEQVRVHVKLLDSSQIHKEEQQVEISCIEKTPEKGIELSLRNQNLFELEHPGTCDADIQTESHQLSLGNSFLMEERLLSIQSNVIDTFKKVQSRLETIQISHQHHQLNQMHLPNQQSHQSPREQQQLLQAQQNEQQKVYQLQPQQIIDQSQQQREYLLMRITEMQKQIKLISEELQQERKEKLKYSQKSISNQQSLNQIEQKQVILQTETVKAQQIQKILQQGQEAKQHILDIENIQSKNQKQASKCPSYMDDSSVEHYIVKRQLVDTSMQTEQIEYSILSLKNQYNQKFNQYIQQNQNPKLKRTISEQIFDEEKGDIVKQMEEKKEMEFVKESDFVTEVKTFEQSQVIVTHVVDSPQKHQFKQESHHILWKPTQSQGDQNPQPIIIQTQTQEKRINLIESETQNLDKCLPTLQYQTIQSKEDNYFVQFDPTEPQIIIDQRHQNKSHSAAKSNNSKNLQQSIVDIYVDSQMMGSVNHNDNGSLISASQNMETKTYNVNNNRSLKLTKKSNFSKDSQSIKQKYLSIVNQLTHQANIYKEELLLTQQVNFKLQQELHETVSKITEFKKEIQSLKINIDIKEKQLIQKQNQLSQKQRQINEKDKALQESNKLLQSQKNQHDEVISSLEGFVNDTSGDNSWSPEKISLVLGKNRQFSQSKKKKLHLDTVRETFQFKEQEENTNTKKQQMAILTESQQAIISRIQTQSIKQENAQDKQIVPILIPHGLSFSGEIIADSKKAQISLQYSETLSIENKNESDFVNQYINKQSLTQQEQIQNEKEHQEQKQKQKETQLVLIPQYSLSNQFQQSEINSHEQKKAQKQVILTEMMIHHTPSQIIKCKQCTIYCSDIKKLQEQINRLNSEMEQLQREIKKKEEADDKVMDQLNDKIQQLSENLQQDQKRILLQQNLQKGLPFIEQIEIKPITSHRISQQAESLSVQTTQIIIPPTQRSQIIQENQQLQELTQKDIDNIFTIENILNLPYICYSVTDKPLQKQEAPLISSSRSRVSSVAKSQQIASELKRLEQAKKQLQLLYEPALIADTQKQPQSKIEQQPRVVFKITSQQECQTQEMIPSYKSIEETPNQKTQTIFTQNKFPLLFISSEINQPQQVQVSKHDKQLFNPLFIASNPLFDDFKKQSHSHFYTEINDFLVENALMNNQNFTASQFVTQKLSCLGVKVFEWLSALKHQNQSLIQENQQSQQSNQDQLLLQDEDDNSRNHKLKDNSKISQHTHQQSSTKILKKITESLGPHFLMLETEDSNLSHEDFLSIALEIESKYLNYNSHKINFR